jgi:hypothetical protein
VPNAREHRARLAEFAGLVGEARVVRGASHGVEHLAERLFAEGRARDLLEPPLEKLRVRAGGARLVARIVRVEPEDDLARGDAAAGRPVVRSAGA